MNIYRRLGLLLFLAGALVGCSQPKRWGTREFEMEFWRLLKADKCEKAMALLAAANARNDPRWFDWMTEAQLHCFEKKVKRPHYGDEALAILDDGIRRFPKSSRLVFLKGYINSAMGETGVANRYYQDVLDLANANIAADKDGRQTLEDRQVAKNARANLGPARRSGS